MPNPMKIRATASGDHTEVKVLMSHIMETGQRRNAAGEPIPAHFIQTVKVEHAGRTVLSAQWGPGVSANPWLAFRFKGGAKGEAVRVTWVDSKGESRSDETSIA
ncbi:MAG: thiosulfate oxidation carrier complex protein SoxZ [Burkholderiales bacterium]|nr:thiosulfate oxidation carrier complex protein SoxZ [Burkholderiales bacterium]